MPELFSKVCDNLGETEKLAQKFADVVNETGAFVCLYGDIGAGKTAFTKFVCKYLGVEQKVTSPSFVILNEYHSGKIPVYHFDLYRLEDIGVKTVISELEEYSEGRILTMVEWAEFSDNQVPFDRIDIKIDYIDENSRKFEFVAYGENNKKILKGLE